MFLSKPCRDHVDRTTSRDWHHHNKNQIETPDDYRLRALVHAYGKDNSNIVHSPSSMPWLNTEEEEFDWGDDVGAPTSAADRGRRDGYLRSSKSSLRISKRPRTCFVAPRRRSTTPLKSDIRNSWSGQAHLPAADDSSIVSEDAVPSHEFARGLPANKNSQKNHNLLSPPPRERPCYMPRHLSQPSRSINSCRRGMKGCFNSRMVSSYDAPNISADGRSVVVSASVVLRPQVHAQNLYPQPKILTTQGQMNYLPCIADPLPPNPVIPNNSSLQAILPPNNADASVSPQQPASSLSGLLNSLMAQGLISLPNPNPGRESLGLEFNKDLLKMRHESVIKSLYDDIPRQCATCGQRFKSQEEHRSHMDWHVTKNRMSKNQKEQTPSRVWFANASLWLGSATDAYHVFLPTEKIEEKKSNEEIAATEKIEEKKSNEEIAATEKFEEKKSNEEIAVPADEDKKVCALCGDPFEEFYSDEAEEWMFEGAVFLKAADESTAGMNRTQLGPAVHVKCRSGSSIVPSEGFGQD